MGKFYDRDDVRQTVDIIGTIMLLGILFYAGTMYGEKTYAVRVHEKANLWISENCLIDGIKFTPKTIEWQGQEMTYFIKEEVLFNETFNSSGWKHISHTK